MIALWSPARRRRFPVPAAAAVLLGLALLAPPINASDALVEMYQAAFLPSSVAIEPGGSVTWAWRKGVHTVTSGQPGGTPGSPDAPGQLFDAVVDESHPSFTHRFPGDTAGSIPFFCRTHPSQMGYVEISTGEISVRVAVVDNQFNPAEVFIFEGDTVRWEHEPNEGLHTVTSGLSSRPEDGPGALFDAESSDLDPIFAFRFTAAGDQPYFCRPHEHMGMKGAVRVQRRFIRGDAAADGRIDISDAISILMVLYSGGPSIPCPDALDADDDGHLGAADAVAILKFLFLGAGPPPAPWPRPGPDRTDDGLLCR